MCLKYSQTPNLNNLNPQVHKVQVNEWNNEDYNLHKLIQAIAVNISSSKPNNWR
jgi:hypothetical protein